VQEPTFLDGAIDALRQIRAKGFDIIVVTNQYLIGEGHISPAQYHLLAQKFLAQLTAAGVGILDVFYCPHARYTGCGCCKPRPGMIEAACQKYPAINFDHALLAGDAVSDVQLANAMGIRAFGIGLDVEGLQYTRVASLREVVNHL
jgi:D-glycero-D-manno-heptose 1,7-bisphosphate phosphatase